MAKQSSIPPILYIADTTAFGGAERYLEEVVAHFSKYTRVKLLLIGPGCPELEKRMADLSIAVIRVADGRQNMWQLYKTLLRHQSWLMHVNLTYYDSCRYVQMVSVWLPHIKIIATIHTLADADVFSGYHRLKEQVRRKVFNRFSLVLAPSNYIGQKLIKERSFPSNKMVVIYNGVQSTNQSSNLKTKIFQLIAVGRLHPDKGHRYLIQALANLKRQNIDFHCTIVGEGALQNDLKNQVKQEDLEKEVEFHGFSDNVQRLLVKSNALVLPSLPDSENFPLTVLEAMSAGLPVIATKVGGVPEQVVGGETGYLVDPGNTEQLAQALQKLISNPKLVNRMGKAGQDRFDQFFTQDKMLCQIEKVYSELINKHNQ